MAASRCSSQLYHIGIHRQAVIWIDNFGNVIYYGADITEEVNYHKAGSVIYCSRFGPKRLNQHNLETISGGYGGLPDGVFSGKAMAMAGHPI